MKVEQKVKSWLKFQGAKKPTEYGRMLIERQRIRFHYNVKEAQLQKYMRMAYRSGDTWPVDHLQQLLESRLDNIVWRLGLARTMAAARQYVKQGHLQWQNGTSMVADDLWRTVNVPSMRLKIGDKIRVSQRTKSSVKVANANLETEWEGKEAQPSSNIQWDSSTLTGTYTSVCPCDEFGMNVDDHYIISWYSGQQGHKTGSLRRRHIRLFEGTRKVIKKCYNGGKIRPTPENILNLKRGIGLNKRGRHRPPCLWGRRYPLNNAYKST